MLLLSRELGCAAGGCVAVVTDAVDAALEAAQRAQRAGSESELAGSVGLGVIADERAEHRSVAQQYGQRAVGHQSPGETHDWPEHAGLGAVRGRRAARQILE